MVVQAEWGLMERRAHRMVVVEDSPSSWPWPTLPRES